MGGMHASPVTYSVIYFNLSREEKRLILQFYTLSFYPFEIIYSQMK